MLKYIAYLKKRIKYINHSHKAIVTISNFSQDNIGWVEQQWFSYNALLSAFEEILFSNFIHSFLLDTEKGRQK